METERTLSYRVFGFENPFRSLLYVFFFLPLMAIIMFPLSLLLTWWFPTVDRAVWIGAPCYLYMLFGLAHVIFQCHRILLSKDRILITWCGIRFKSIRPEDLKLLCAVGDEWNDRLCLSCYTTEELARMEEASMQRNWITRHEIPFLKRQPNHENRLARKHLLRSGKKAFLILQKKKIVFLPMRMDVLEQLRGLYPRLPYKNYTECKKYRENLYGDKDERLSAYSEDPFFHPEIWEDRILYYSGKTVKRIVPLTQIRSVVRIDLFMVQHRHAPHHMPLLFLSDLSIEQMSERSRLHQGSTALRAYCYAYDRGMRWRITSPDCCNLPCTEEMIHQLQELCPNVQWLDLSDRWLTDSPCASAHLQGNM